MTQAENGVLSELAKAVKRLRHQVLAQSQIGGVHSTDLQILWNKLEAVEVRLAQQEEINLNLAQRLEALEAAVVPGQAGVH